MRLIPCASFVVIVGVILSASSAVAQHRQFSGIYPHLAMYNENGECGVGGVVPWGDRLWVITYSPHFPKGSDDKLYEITSDLTQIVRPESLGGTPANRMIHRESQQLFIGPYAIRLDGTVRAIPYDIMPGRHTGNARHLFRPDNRIYFATMEEGIYDVDVNSLEVTEVFADDQEQTGHGPKDEKVPAVGRFASLPGYHGKGLYSGQGVVVYANNGEASFDSQRKTDIPSGSLSEWDGKSREWKVIRRNQFTEVTGPGGIAGNRNPATDPIWSVGWDSKSILLGVRMPESTWSFYRLPKSSHSYDGAHGWNTEWPRIRDIGAEALLMTMHGTFWKFPMTFTPTNSSGIEARSDYLKVIGDFCRWNDRVVFGCDDVARNAFMNRRKAKGTIHPPQSHSNLWFTDPEVLDQLGPPIGRGLVWNREDVAAGVPSDPFLFSGYDHRCLHVAHVGTNSTDIVIEVDANGDGNWTTLRQVQANNYTFVEFQPHERGVWVRLICDSDVKGITAAFSYRDADLRDQSASPIFDGLARPGQDFTGGLVRSRGENKKTMSFLAKTPNGRVVGYYELDESMNLTWVKDESLASWTEQNAALPKEAILVDNASVVFVDDDGHRWRLPKGHEAFDEYPLSEYRVDRELVTERDLFNAHGTFYELPSPNAGGIMKIRPVATHNRLIHDYCGYRGLMIISGLSNESTLDNPHIIKSNDGRTSLWAGAIDDIWKLGKPRGVGGPWKGTNVIAGEPSDPYLMTGYDEKTVRLSHDASSPVTIVLQVDIDGHGLWVPYRQFKIPPNMSITYEFPTAFSAYWIRAVSNRDTTATVMFDYR